MNTRCFKIPTVLVAFLVLCFFYVQYMPADKVKSEGDSMQPGQEALATSMAKEEAASDASVMDTVAQETLNSPQVSIDDVNPHDQVEDDDAPAPTDAAQPATTEPKQPHKVGHRGTVLVTGGLGFIGSHLVEELLEQGCKVVIYDDESTGHNHNDGAKELQGDVSVVTDIEKLNELALDEPIRYMVHLAAAISVAESMKNPEKYVRINVDGSRRMLDWARAHEVMNVVAASSAAVYGDPDPSLLPLSEDVKYGGLSPYAKSKYEMEVTMAEFWEHHKLPSTALRFFNVYGPRQDPHSPYSGVISLFMQQALDKKDLTVLGDGQQTRDFVFVKDIAKAIRTALFKQAPDGFSVYNVCTGTTVTVQQMAETIIKLWGSDGASTVVNKEPRAGDIRHSSCKPDALLANLGFKPSVTLEDGLAQTLDWFKTKQ